MNIINRGLKVYRVASISRQSAVRLYSTTQQSQPKQQQIDEYDETNELGINIKSITKKISDFYTPQVESITLKSNKTKQVNPLIKCIDLNQQGFNLISQGKYKEAEPILQSALTLYKKSMASIKGKQENDISFVQVYGYILGNIATVYHNMGFKDDALSFYTQSIEYLESEFDQLFYGTVLLNYSELLSLLQKNEDSIQQCKKAISVLESIKTPITDERINMAYLNLSSYLYVSNNQKEALEYAEKSFKGLDKAFGRQSDITRTAATNLAKIYMSLKMKSELEALDSLFTEKPSTDIDFKIDSSKEFSHIDFTKLRSEWNQLGHQRAFDIDGFFKSSETSKKEFISFFKQLEDNGIKVGSETAQLLESELSSLDYAPDRITEWSPNVVSKEDIMKKIE
ncbi:hypothetical protein CYY_000803 [Polysphondylium violaceum]|uniref:TPR repeat-containing protein n=1 Tax=Polysphondylium violaceum TaxID=133409 RepID=A0A8J4V250_9MYCE|nr:hypothetical protein CYY_000803 [Polysphondylium violaceum]